MSEDIKFLNDYQHARLRTEMYLGARVPTVVKFPIYDDLSQTFKMQDIEFTPAALTAFREALDNHLDELSFIGKGEIKITYNENTGEITSEDNGRGIPIDFNTEKNGYTATLVVSQTKAGRNFGERGEQAGTNGLGISVVNYCSEYFRLAVFRDGKHFYQGFAEGEEDLIIHDPVISEFPKRHGTMVSFKLSSKVFPDLKLPLKLVESLVMLIAATNPRYKFFFNKTELKASPNIGQNVFGKDYAHEFKFEDAVNHGSYFVKMTEDDTSFFSLVNNIPAYNGGTHDDEIKYHFPRQLLEALTKESKRRKLSPNKNDVLDNLFFFGTMKVKAPNFDSQSKTRLTNKEAKWAIFKCLTEQTDWQKFIKECPALIEAIYKRCAERTHKQDKSQIDADANKLKKLKIASLIEANSNDRQKCILFITEGDSAKGGMNNVRNPAIHAVMPLRGKILNVFDKKPAEALKSKIIEQLCAAIGLVPGRRADVASLRYGKIYIMADADDDGQGSICPLVVELFNKYWPELFDLDEPFVHIFSTPLIIAERKNERKYFYPHNMHEFDSAKFKGWSIRRAKGLGSLQSENFKDHLENPVSIAVNRDIMVPHVLNLLFNGGRSNDRKAMMEMTTDEVMQKIEESGSDWTSNALDI